MKLRSKLTLAFVLMSVVPLSVIVLYSYFTSLETLQMAALSDVAELTAEIGDAVSMPLAPEAPPELATLDETEPLDSIGSVVISLSVLAESAAESWSGQTHPSDDITFVALQVKA